ncbi:putative virion structural protein [Erwinia phage vB_EamM_ChrisDB]|uniref:putative virion structural protein n=1 Tax=Erwinia phage vB_EamM_ChrisDB TaxID=1883371 RepID=UPI00081CC413|nr:putative virion structural protein [Erwinia phage vB_EamM_ChrisDB]ANZ48731.1 putative virion structural protein [Erwinia phage vB_EamM_ChrisDB]
MALKLTWANPNVVANSIAIYRGDAELNPAALPTPLVVLTNGETTWTDATADYGKTFYYILGTRTANDEVLTASQKILVADNRGIGPSILKFGDDNLGYYGTVLSSDFVGFPDLQAVAAVTMSTLTWNPVWHKFVRNGKIIYVPDGVPPDFYTWQQIYQFGFMYGIDANYPPGLTLTGLTPTNQNRIIDFKGQKYRVRTIRGWSDDPVSQYVSTVVNGTESDAAALAIKNNEFSDFIYALMTYVPLKQRTENYVETADPGLYVGGAMNAGFNQDTQILEMNRGRVLCQERDTGGVTANMLTRGLRPVGYSSVPGWTKANLTYIQSRPANVQARWLPVLELIDSVAL